MKYKNSCLIFVVLLYSFLEFGALAQEDPCTVAQLNCNECINAHPSCVWCADVQRINTLQRRRCWNISSISDCRNIINPNSEIKLMQIGIEEMQSSASGSSTESQRTALFPEAMNIKLRVGQPLKVNVTFQKRDEYPLDLYYLLDLSYSMKDDLQQLQSLGENLVNVIRTDVTRNVYLGFGTFVDKILLPYATNQVSVFERICPDDCQPAFGFRHQLKLNKNGTVFREAVLDTVISANLDTPEGGLDALMQIAVCKEKIGWRRGALHVVLFTSDAPSHVALDGKLAGIFSKNKMDCSLEMENENGGYTYSKSSFEDYPSIGQLRKVFQDNDIQVIFAVTENVYDNYKDLEKLLPATVQIVQNDSGNIVSVLSEAYERIRRRFEMTDPRTNLPENIKVSFNVLCPNEGVWKQDSLECTNVLVGDKVVFQLEFTAKSCPSNPEQIDIVPLTFSAIDDDLNISISYHCECNCTMSDTKNLSFCNGQGELKCGLCECDSGRSGSACQCPTSFTSEIEQNCTDPSPKSSYSNSLCNNNGLCECGDCAVGCYPGYYGDYCECRDNGCKKRENELECGGSSRGTCQNCYEDKMCVCNKAEGWYLSEEGFCDCNDNECKADPSDSQLCSGNGVCDCADCVCTNNSLYWSGKFCEECIHPNCSDLKGTCESSAFSACAACVFNLESATECQQLCRNMKINFRAVETLPDCGTCATSSFETGCDICEELNLDLFRPITCTNFDEECEISYAIAWNLNPSSYILLVQRQRADNPCNEPFDPTYYVLAATGAFVLLFIIGLIVWKINANIRDKKNYEQFLEDLRTSKWASVNNELYVGAESRYENPNFIGTNDDVN